MRKLKKFTRSRYFPIVLIVLFVAVSILAYTLFNGGTVKNWIILAVLAVLAILFLRVVNKPGFDKLWAWAGPGLLAALKALSGTSFSDFASRVVNAPLGWFGSDKALDEESCLIILFFLVFLFVYILESLISARIAKGFDKTLTAEQEALCSALSRRMERINEQMNLRVLSDAGRENRTLQSFTPMDAEVEVRIGSKRKKRYDDLLKCLKQNRKGKTVFLVKGNPGSGKSVALRKLSTDLMRNVQDSGRIPVYINLKHWNEAWTAERLPTVDDLIVFIKKQILHDLDGLDGPAKKYLEEHFDELVPDGKLYFLFDSFDEMPCLIGANTSYQLIDGISETLSAFLRAGQQDGGVVASRYYHAPSEDRLGANILLWIQDFDEYKIKTMLEKYLGKANAKEICAKLFRDRNDLARLCSNPFYLTLLIDYVAKHGDALYAHGDFLPESQMVLYESYLGDRLAGRGSGKERERREEKLWDAAEQIAVFMQKTEPYASDCTVGALQEHLGQTEDHWSNAVQTLQAGGLLRCDEHNHTFTFIHRRFQEFFLVKHLQKEGKINKGDLQNSILHNSGMRDAYVLYCEVAELRVAQKIADFCWKVVRGEDRVIPYSSEENKHIDTRLRNISNEGSLSLYYTLGFLTEAFRNRPAALTGLIADIENFISKKLEAAETDSIDLLLLTALTGCVELFRTEDDEQRERKQNAVLCAFRLGNRWLSDIAMQSCRSLGPVNAEVAFAFCRYFQRMEPAQFFKRYRSIHYSLSFSEGFRYVRRSHLLCLLWYFAVALNLLALLAFWLIKSLLVGQLLFSTVPWRGAGAVLTMYLTSIIIVVPIYLSLFEFHEFRDKAGGAIQYIVSFGYGILFFFLLNQSMNVIRSPLGMLPLLLLGALPLLLDLCSVAHCGGAKKVLNAETLTIVFVAVLIGTALLLPLRMKDTSSVLRKISGIIGYISLGIGWIYLSWKHGFPLLRIARDKYWVRKENARLSGVTVKRISRASLETYLEKLRTDSGRRAYLELLKQRQVLLEGAWPDSERPRYGDEDVDILLAELDKKSLEATQLPQITPGNRD